MGQETSGDGQGQGNGGGGDGGAGDSQGGGAEQQPSLEGPAQIVDFAKGQTGGMKGEFFTQLVRRK